MGGHNPGVLTGEQTAYDINILTKMMMLMKTMLIWMMVMVMVQLVREVKLISTGEQPATDKDDVNNGEHFIDFVDNDGNTVLEREEVEFFCILLLCRCLRC